MQLIHLVVQLAYFDICNENVQGSKFLFPNYRIIKKEKEKDAVHRRLFVEVSKLANMAAKIMYEF